jgi:hypothetical protein
MTNTTLQSRLGVGVLVLSIIMAGILFPASAHAVMGNHNICLVSSGQCIDKPANDKKLQ